MAQENMLNYVSTDVRNQHMQTVDFERNASNVIAYIVINAKKLQ